MNLSNYKTLTQYGITQENIIKCLNEDLAKSCGPENSEFYERIKRDFDYYRTHKLHAFISRFDSYHAGKWIGFYEMLHNLHTCLPDDKEKLIAAIDRININYSSDIRGISSLEYYSNLLYLLDKKIVEVKPEKYNKLHIKYADENGIVKTMIIAGEIIETVNEELFDTMSVELRHSLPLSPETIVVVYYKKYSQNIN